MAAILSRTGAVAVPNSHGLELDPDTMRHHHLLHAHTIHARIPVVEAYW